MKNTKRFLMALACAAAAAAFAFALVGCGGGSASSSSSASTAGNAASSSASGSAASSSSSGTTASSSSSASYKTEATGKYAKGNHVAVVTVDGYDPFEIELDADSAPVTVSNFCELANDGFYDGITFHRIVEGFCLQGGDPTGSGSGGSEEEILGEFSENDVNNPLADNFEKGTVAMARTSLPNSASSQFFITLASDDSVSLALNGKYAAFGTVDKDGMKIVDKIVKDYAGNTDASGIIADKDDMPTIASIAIQD